MKVKVALQEFYSHAKQRKLIASPGNIDHSTSKPKSKCMDPRNELLKNLFSRVFISKKAIFAALQIKNSETLIMILHVVQGLCSYTMLHIINPKCFRIKFRTY